MRTRIKICGITRSEDAEIVAESGADAMGMIFYPKSPRYVSLKQARIQCEIVQPLITTVAVVVNESPSNLEQIIEATKVDRIQFHGDEDQAICNQSVRPWYKVLRVKDKFDIAEKIQQYPQASGFLLDTYVKGVPGGTGQVFDWSMISELKFDKPVLLAGGLSPQNVYQAIIKAKPYAVDVNSGVEIKPGIKDAVMINEFIIAVREADERLQRKR